MIIKQEQLKTSRLTPLSSGHSRIQILDLICLTFFSHSKHIAIPTLETIYPHSHRINYLLRFYNINHMTLHFVTV